MPLLGPQAGSDEGTIANKADRSLFVRGHALAPVGDASAGRRPSAGRQARESGCWALDLLSPEMRVFT